MPLVKIISLKLVASQILMIVPKFPGSDTSSKITKLFERDFKSLFFLLYRIITPCEFSCELNSSKILVVTTIFLQENLFNFSK